MLPLALILVLHLLAAEAVPQLQQLNHILRRLLEHYKTIDVPSVETHPVLSVQHEFSKKFEDNEHDLIISVECV